MGSDTIQIFTNPTILISGEHYFITLIDDFPLYGMFTY